MDSTRKGTAAKIVISPGRTMEPEAADLDVLTGLGGDEWLRVDLGQLGSASDGFRGFKKRLPGELSHLRQGFALALWKSRVAGRIGWIAEQSHREFFRSVERTPSLSLEYVHTTSRSRTSCLSLVSDNPFNPQKHRVRIAVLSGGSSRALDLIAYRIANFWPLGLETREEVEY